MPKTKLRHNGSKDNEETRLVAAQTFQAGDRYEHKLTGRFGIFLEINLGFALPSVWVQFESDIECSVPVSCNPLDLELANSEITDSEELPSYSAEWESEPSVSVEQPSTAVEVVQELTESEAAERHRLELRVEKAFYQAGLALKELKERKLFRSTHSNFDVYCRDRFRFSRDKADLLIKAVSVVDNLEKSDNCRTFLPTAESQVRDLVDLTPAFQCEIYAQAVEEAGGKVPSRRIVKGIVSRLKERNATPPRIPYTQGDVVEIRAGSNSTLRKHNGLWGIITHVGTFSCKVHIGVRNINVQCLPDEMDPVDPKYTASIRAVHQRITALSELDARSCYFVDAGNPLPTNLFYPNPDEFTGLRRTAIWNFPEILVKNLVTPELYFGQSWTALYTDPSEQTHILKTGRILFV